MNKREGALKKLQDKLNDIQQALINDVSFVESLIEGDIIFTRSRDKQKKILDKQKKILNAIDPWRAPNTIHQSYYVLIASCILSMLTKSDYKQHKLQREPTCIAAEEEGVYWGYTDEDDNYTDED